MKNEIEVDGVIYIRKDSVKKGDYTDIKSFNDACQAIGTNELEFNELFANLPEDTIAYEKLKIISKAINQGWTPDWDNNNQKKWYPYFNLSSGFGFSGTHYSYGNSDTYVGSRLCFESSEKAKYAGNEFVQIYEKFLK